MKRRLTVWTGLALLATLLFTGAAQTVAQDEVGKGGWELERVLGRGAIEDLSISPDGSTLAVAGSRGVWLYSLPQLELHAHLDADWVIRAAWSPDGKQIATVNGSFVRTREEMELLPPLLAALFPVDGHYLFFTNIQPVRVWDTASGTLLRSLENSHSTRRIAWTQAGGPLLGSDFDGAVRQWDPEAGETSLLDAGRKGQLPHDFFSPDGLYLARFTLAYGIAVRSTKTGSRRFSDIISHTSYTWSYDDLVSWSPDSRRLAGGGPGTWRVWNAQDGRLLFTRPVDQVPLLAWSPDAERLALRDDWSELHLLDATSGAVLLELDHEQSVHGLAWSPDGQHLAVALGNGRVLLRDAVTGTTRLILEHVDAFHQDAPGLLWTPDTRLLVTHTRSGDIRVWNADTGQQLAVRREHGAWTHGMTTLFLSGWVNDSQVLAGGSLWDIVEDLDNPLTKGPLDSLLSPGATRLAWHEPNVVVIEDPATGERLYELPSRYKSYGIAWSPDGRHLAVTTGAGGMGQLLVRVWNVTDIAFILDEYVEDTFSFKLAGQPWSPDGRMLATGGTAGDVMSRDSLATVRIRDIQDRSLWTVLPTDQRFPGSVAWSPDGRFLVNGNLTTLTLWKVNVSANYVKAGWSVNKEDVGRVTDIAWSPDGRYIATANGVPSTQFEPHHLPGLVAIYDAADGGLLATLAGHTDEVIGVAWSPDGERLASYGKDQVLRIWRAPEND